MANIIIHIHEDGIEVYGNESGTITIIDTHHNPPLIKSSIVEIVPVGDMEAKELKIIKDSIEYQNELQKLHTSVW